MIVLILDLIVKEGEKNVVDNSKELEELMNKNSNTIKSIKTKATKIIK